MKITICGSIAFHKEMLALKKELETKGHQVYSPDLEIEGEKKKKDLETRKSFPQVKGEAILRHFEKIEWADVILVANYEKKGIKGYIGGSTLMEMAVAFHFQKPMYLLETIPDLSYQEEIIGMQPIILHGDISKL